MVPPAFHGPRQLSQRRADATARCRAVLRRRRGNCRSGRVPLELRGPLALDHLPEIGIARANNFSPRGNLLAQSGIVAIEWRVRRNDVAFPSVRLQISQKAQRSIDRGISFRREPVSNHHDGFHGRHRVAASPFCRRTTSNRFATSSGPCFEVSDES